MDIKISIIGALSIAMLFIAANTYWFDVFICLIGGIGVTCLYHALEVLLRKWYDD